MRRKIGALLASVAVVAGMLVGCGGAPATPAGDKIRVVCTTFPQYDWARQVMGDEAERFDLTLLLDQGVDLHNYQPTVDDMATVADCDLFVYVGGESDGWVSDALANAPQARSLNLMEALGDAVREEELVEGMQPEDDENEPEPDESGESGEPEYDEHVWLSLCNVQALVVALADELAALDPDNAQAYARNAASYAGELAVLDERYAAMVEAAPRDTVVFADRFPFRYLMDDYGIAYYAAFAGCSAETEASFETVAFLSQKADELGLDAVLVLEGSDMRIAQTVVDNTRDKDQRIVAMDSLQSVTAADVAAGRTYLAAMEDNLAALGEALS